MKPGTFPLWCFHSDNALKDVTWSEWGSSRAKGRGTYTVNTCRISCAEGPWKDYPATVVADRVRRVDGTAAFTRIVFTFDDRGPGNRSSLTLRLRFLEVEGCNLTWTDPKSTELYGTCRP